MQMLFHSDPKSEYLILFLGSEMLEAIAVDLLISSHLLVSFASINRIYEQY